MSKFAGSNNLVLIYLSINIILNKTTGDWFSRGLTEGIASLLIYPLCITNIDASTNIISIANNNFIVIK